MNKKRAWKLAATLLILTPALTSLTSCATKNLPEARPFERPEVPDPYNQDGQLCVSYNPDTGRVTMDFFYWKKVVRYMADAEAALDIAESQLQQVENK